MAREQTSSVDKKNTYQLYVEMNNELLTMGFLCYDFLLCFPLINLILYIGALDINGVMCIIDPQAHTYVKYTKFDQELSSSNTVLALHLRLPGKVLPRLGTTSGNTGTVGAKASKNFWMNTLTIAA